MQDWTLTRVVNAIEALGVYVRYGWPGFLVGLVVGAGIIFLVRR